MRSNPKVCVEVDEVTGHSSWVSVIISGRYQELPNTPEHSSERRHAYSLLESARSGGRLLKRPRSSEQHNPFRLSSIAFTSTP